MGSPDSWLGFDEIAVRPLLERRATWDEYAIGLAVAAAVRSEDPYVRVGAVVLRTDHSVAALGYNGAPPGVEINWSDRDARRQRVIHAETNALRYLRPGEGYLIAVTLMPCVECLKLARAHGIHEVRYKDDLPDYYDPSLVWRIAGEFGMNMRKVK